MPNDGPIIVRDRRKQRQFSISNEVLDDFYSIIERTGYVLYSLYVRMASAGEERSWPGFALIGGHLKLTNRTIASYNRLLSWCGLIHIEPGNRRRSNTYYVLDVPPMTAELRRAILRRAREELEDGDPFLSLVERRIQRWQPWTAHFAEKPRLPQVVVASHQQMAMTLDGDPHGDGDDVGAATSPDRGQDLGSGGPNEDVAALLAEFGVENPMRDRLARQVRDVAAVQAWIWRCQEEELGPGYLVNRLRAGDAPPDEYLPLARAVIALNDDDQTRLHSAAVAYRWTWSWDELGGSPTFDGWDEDMLKLYVRLAVPKQDPKQERG